ncbi:hypothetical protein ES702_01433 [subsurface metagenome]
MNEKIETSLGMYVNDDIIRVGDIVSYLSIDKINKARFEPLPSNKWVVRRIKYQVVTTIRVHHLTIEIIHLSDTIDKFKKVILK